MTIQISTANFALVAEVSNPGDHQIYHNVNYYVKDTYNGDYAPHLLTTYTDMQKPTLLVENNTSFGGSRSEVYMLNGSTWYKGGTPIGTTIDGILACGLVLPDERTTVLLRNTTSPSHFERYSGSGPLQKTTASGGTVDLIAVRQWGDSLSGITTAMLDFAGAEVEILDTVDAGPSGVAVKILSPAEDGTVARQPVDSLILPIAVDLVRNGTTIRSFTASSWSCLTTGSLSGFEAGDVLMFHPAGASGKALNAYTVVSVKQPVEIAKREEMPSCASGDLLTPTAEQLYSYPNPFNPQTTLRYTLPEAARVSLRVYDVLGREVASLVDGYSEAGYHEVRWNASSVSSGIYYARFLVTDDLGKVKFTKVNKLLLMK